MVPDDRQERDFDKAVSEAAAHVAQTEAAVASADAATRRRSRVPALVVLWLVLLAVLVWDYRVLNRPPELPPEAVRLQDLRYSVATLVREVEAFRRLEGRLPNAGELAAEELLEEGLRYEPAEERYVVEATEGELTVRFDGSESVEAWLDGTEGAG